MNFFIYLLQIYQPLHQIFGRRGFRQRQMAAPLTYKTYKLYVELNYSMSSALIQSGKEDSSENVVGIIISKSIKNSYQT